MQDFVLRTDMNEINNPYTDTEYISFTLSTSVLTDCFCRDSYHSNKEFSFPYLFLSYIYGVQCNPFFYPPAFTEHKTLHHMSSGI